jgi:hypothetical protein
MKNRIQMKKNITQNNNFYWLTFSLVTFLVLFALEQSLNMVWLGNILPFLILFPIFVSVVSLRFDRYWFRFLLIMIFIWVLIIFCHRWLPIKLLSIASLLLMLAFFMATFKTITKQVLFAGKIDNNKIVGSVAQFLLLGLMWTMVYLLILEFFPFAFNGVVVKPWAENFSQMAYFSFVTLSTLGYGEITPKLPLAQVIVYLESITGIFYMAIVVSSLVNNKK